jgi:hypothetical protein
VFACVCLCSCWEHPGAPDEQGVQFAAVKAHLLASPAIEWVWYGMRSSTGRDMHNMYMYM